MNLKSAGPKTGITLPYSIHSRHRKASQLVRIADPIAKQLASTRTLQYPALRKPVYDFNSIHTAYLADSYVRQGIDKYVELLLKDGWTLEGGAEQVTYLENRFKLMGLMSDPPTPLPMLVERIVRDFIKYGNSMLVVKRTRYLSDISNNKISGLFGKPPIGALFALPITQMIPIPDKNGNIVSWEQHARSGAVVSFSADDVIHFSFCREPGDIWGTPSILPVIEDVRALRQIEENIIKLIYKYLNPLIQHETPDITGTGEGRQEDVDAAIDAVQSMAVDGYIITPPGHKISVIGAESQAIRAEGYYKMFKQRVFSGLGVSSLVMGETDSGAGSSADSLTTQMHNKARFYQYLLSNYLTYYILNELLLEGGYNPYTNPDDIVIWKWAELEPDRVVKQQTHWTNLWSLNAISATELREKLGLPGNVDWKDYYVHQVQIPQLLASKLGVDPLELSDEELRMPLDALATKDKPKQDSITAQGGNTQPPTRKNTPAPTSSSEMLTKALVEYSNICEKLNVMIPDIKSGKENEAAILAVLPDYLPEYAKGALAKALYADIVENDEITAGLRINARLSNERALILAYREAATARMEGNDG